MKAKTKSKAKAKNKIDKEEKQVAIAKEAGHKADDNDSVQTKSKVKAKSSKTEALDLDDDEDLASPSASAIDTKTLDLDDEEDLTAAHEAPARANASTSKRFSLSNMRIMIVKPRNSATFNGASDEVKRLYQRYQSTEGLVVSHNVATGECIIKLDDQNQMEEHQIDVGFVSTKNVAQLSA